MDIGFDGGYFATKAVGNNRKVIFPSFATLPVESLFDELNGETKIVIESDKGKYLIGQEAIKKGRLGVRKETANWIESQEYHALFLAALSELTNASQATVNLVSGLPLADYKRNKNIAKGMLEGVHQFSRNGRSRQNIKVNSVRIVPQAWGAVLSLLLNDKGKIVSPELADQKTAVLDIGGHTVNYLGIDGLSDLPTESHSTERGTWNVVRAIREFLNTYHPGLSRLSDHALMDKMIKNEVYDGHRWVALAHVVEPLVKSIGQEIIDTASQYWGIGAATYRLVLVCGGGAHLWGGMIKQAFPHAMILPKPEFANALGFHRFAVHLSNG